MSAELAVTDTNFEAEAAGGLLLVDFWAPWCGPCRMQGPIVDKVAEKMAGKIKMGKCNVDEAQKLAVKFGIRSIPTLIVFKDGRETLRLVGLQTENVLTEKLNKLVT